MLPGEGLAPKTERWYGEMLDLLLPVVGQRTLTGPRALTPSDVETLQARMPTARTADAVRTTLSKLLRSAEARGLISRNAARLAKRRRDAGKVREVKALTVDEVAVLLDALNGTRWHPIVVVGVTTGLRPGELLALHWSDVELGHEPHVSVRHALTYVGGVHLNPETLEELPDRAARSRGRDRAQIVAQDPGGRAARRRHPVVARLA